VALQQLNLKVPPAALDHWRAQAAAEGLSVRDWLLARLGPAAAGPPAPDLLADRVALLERTTAELAAALAQLQRFGPAAAPRSPGPDPVEVPLGVAPLPPPAELPPLPSRRLTVEEAQGLLTTPEVSQALGLASDSAITNWIRRQTAKRGGSAVGATYRGHRLRGMAQLPGASRPGWLWERLPG
jgi:hypothetical protein